VARRRAFRVLCGGVGLACVALGLAAAFQFFSYHSFALRRPGEENPVPLDPYAVYFLAFAGCALVGWGGGLLAAARSPRGGRAVAAASALALVLAAVHRMFGWMLGDYPLFSDLLRAEAAGFLLLALAFVWLSPAREAGP
jgi:hypothetical protein